MDEQMLTLKRVKMRRNEVLQGKNKENNSKVSIIFSKILLSIIFLLASCIYIHLDNKNKELYNKYVFETNLTFAKMNEWYDKTFGSILPTVTIPESTVSSEVNTSLMEKYLDGYKIMSGTNAPIEAKTSGILVYLDEKEGYNNTAIIQGIDGVDIWYGNITDTSHKLYDYIEKGTILGSNKDNFHYEVYYKDGASISIEEYEAS